MLSGVQGLNPFAQDVCQATLSHGAWDCQQTFELSDDCAKHCDLASRDAKRMVALDRRFAGPQLCARLIRAYFLRENHQNGVSASDLMVLSCSLPVCVLPIKVKTPNLS